MDDPASQLSLRGFQGAADTPFQIRPGGSDSRPFTVRLVDIQVRPAPPGFEQFSLLFVGPASPVWPQGTYRFAHADLGELDLFMAPVGCPPAGVEYEVCISRDARGDPRPTGAGRG